MNVGVLEALRQADKAKKSISITCLLENCQEENGFPTFFFSDQVIVFVGFFS